MWAIALLSNLARYTYNSKKRFEPMQFVKGSGASLRLGTDSKITSIITILDTEAEEKDTIYGKTKFIQFVGIMEEELQKIIGDRSNIELLVQRMKEDNPDMVTDMKREKAYL